MINETVEKKIAKEILRNQELLQDVSVHAPNPMICTYSTEYLSYIRFRIEALGDKSFLTLLLVNARCFPHGEVVVGKPFNYMRTEANA